MVNKNEYKKMTSALKEYVYSSVWETHRRATERYLPYGITHCYIADPTRHG